MSAALVEDSRRVDLDAIPLCALSSSTRSLLCNLLDTKKLIPSDDNLPRDWRGLAQLAGIIISSDSNNPTDSVINKWQLSANTEPRPTMGTLLSFLGQIDRWDVFDDVLEKMENDAREHLVRMKKPLEAPISERDIITVDDLRRSRQGLPLETYDAFFLYTDEDADFANNIVTLLERDYNLRLCLRDRDLVGGVGLEHDAIMRLIAFRCSRVIVIISQHFINSNAHKFFFKFAEALSIDKNARKIVPCIYNASIVDIPPEFKFYFLLDFSRSKSLQKFCDRLKESIEPRLDNALAAPPVSANVNEDTSEFKCTIEEVSSEMNSKLSVSSSMPVSVSSSSQQVATQVVPMPDPSAFLSPEKSKLDFEASAESSSKSESKPSASKPLSPAVKIKNLFKGSKSSSSECQPNGSAVPKAKKKNNSWFSSKKKIAVAES